VLGGQPGVPVHLVELELEQSIVLLDFDMVVVDTGNHLHWKHTVLISNRVSLVNDGGNVLLVLVQDDLPDHILVHQAVISEVQVGDMPDLFIRGWYVQYRGLYSGASQYLLQHVCHTQFGSAQH